MCRTEECGGEMETMMPWAEGQVPPVICYKVDDGIELDYTSGFE
jgi:hypothetical protein